MSWTRSSTDPSQAVFSHVDTETFCSGGRSVYPADEYAANAFGCVATFAKCTLNPCDFAIYQTIMWNWQKALLYWRILVHTSNGSGHRTRVMQQWSSVVTKPLIACMSAQLHEAIYSIFGSLFWAFFAHRLLGEHNGFTGLSTRYFPQELEEKNSRKISVLNLKRLLDSAKNGLFHKHIR